MNTDPGVSLIFFTFLDELKARVLLSVQLLLVFFDLAYDLRLSTTNVYRLSYRWLRYLIGFNNSYLEPVRTGRSLELLQI